MKALLLAASAASLAFAADVKPFDAKLGLWETTTIVETEGMPAMPARQMPQIPKETLDKMPPAQRAQVEAMLKNNSGAGGAKAGAPRTVTSRSCTTKESLAKGFAMPESKGVDCKRDIVSSSSTKLVMHVQCAPTGGGPSSGGDVTMERVDAGHVKGTMLSKTTVQEKTITMKMAFDSKWISTDCGDVKPSPVK